MPTEGRPGTSPRPASWRRAVNRPRYTSHPPTSEAAGTPRTVAIEIPEKITDAAHAARAAGTRRPPMLAPIAQNPPMPRPSRNRPSSIVAKFGAAVDTAPLTVNSPAISSSTSRRSSRPAATASAGEAMAATTAGTVTMVAAASWETRRLVRIPVSNATGRQLGGLHVECPATDIGSGDPRRRVSPELVENACDIGRRPLLGDLPVRHAIGVDLVPPDRSPRCWEAE